MSDIIETVTEESENLELHTKLCAQRYQQLIHKFDVVDSRLNKIDATLVEIKECLGRQESHKYQTYLTWAGVVITALAGGIFHLMTLIK